MEYLLDLFLHSDQHLNTLIATYQVWTYGILFLILFMETGVVITPFLPGDSLLFAAGALAAADGSSLNVVLLFFVLFLAAVLGDTANYSIGKAVGPRVFQRNYRLLKPEYLERTERFYVQHGGKTIVVARFVPVIRTFAPFVAGVVGAMRYSQFALYNVLGALVWTALFIFGGYLFGNIPFVQKNFEFVIVVILLAPGVPIIVDVVRRRSRRRNASTPSAG